MMHKCRMVLSFAVIIKIIVLSNNIYCSAESKDVLTEKEINKTLGVLEAMSSKKKKKKYDQLSIHKLDDMLVEKISTRIYKVIQDFSKKENSVFQTALSQIRKKSEHLFLKKLPEYGQANRSDESNNMHFSEIWLRSINSIFEEEIEVVGDKLSEEEHDIISFSDDESEEEEQENSEKSKKAAMFKTTLLNILLRQKSCLELAEKVQTLIENGANKNLHHDFSSSPKMENQKEYPLYIILNEIDDKVLRNKILKTFLNDNISYSYKKIVPDNEHLVSAIESLEPNKDFVLTTLIDKNDFPTFNIVLDYLEKSAIFITKTYSDKIAQIDDQIYCPILETILKKMMLVRRKSVSSDENGQPIDNVNEFFNSKKLSGQMKVNPDAKFSLNFQNRLDKDFESIFKKIAVKIDRTRTESELNGVELKRFIIEWTQWANYRNRIAKHLNKFALSASNEGQKSNVIKLIRYANIYDKKDITSEQDEVFRELHSFGAAEIIFTTRNKLKWTPLMYAMFQKQSEGIQLYLRQAPHEITSTDGVDNNILHLAFPLPSKYFKQEAHHESENVLELVGANVGIEGAKEKTFEAIRAIITEKSISVEDKITALTQLSASNFTPVSLAAATGYVEVYEFLIRFLKANNAWNEDDHSHLGIRVNELMVSGLKTYKASREKHDNLSSYENNHIMQQIEEREKDLSHINHNCIREIFHPESSYAMKILREIKKPTMAVMDDFYAQKGTKRKIAPYAEAISAAMEEINNPKPKIEKELVPMPLPVAPIVEEPKKEEKKSKRLWKKLFSRNKKKDLKDVVNEVVQEPTIPEPIYREKRVPSVLEGLKYSTSAVKGSYLAQIVREITELFLRDHVSPQQMSFSAVYKGLTNTEVKEFFQKNFNLTIEKKMQDTIISTLKKAGRYREDEEEENSSTNRFDNFNSVENSECESSEIESSSESDSGDELGL